MHDHREENIHKRGVWAVGIVLVIMAATTIGAGWMTAQVTKNRLHEFFDRQADQIANTFYADMASNVMTLQGVQGLWNAQGKFDYKSFSTYVKT